MEIDSAPISRCSKEHQKVYQEWFSYADSGMLLVEIHYYLFICLLFMSLSLTHECWLLDGDGRLTGADATKFFSMSNIPRQDLKQVITFDCLLYLRFSIFAFVDHAFAALFWEELVWGTIIIFIFWNVPWYMFMVLFLFSESPCLCFLISQLSVGGAKCVDFLRILWF